MAHILPEEEADIMLRPMAARHLTPGLKVLQYHYSAEDDTLVPVIVTVAGVKRMFGRGPVLGYSYAYPGGQGEVGGGIDAVILVEELDPGARAQAQRPGTES